jgi:hypothetical protein
MNKILKLWSFLSGTFSIGSSIGGLKATKLQIVVTFADLSTLDTEIVTAVVKLVEAHESVAYATVSGNVLTISCNI